MQTFREFGLNKNALEFGRIFCQIAYHSVAVLSHKKYQFVGSAKICFERSTGADNRRAFRMWAQKYDFLWGESVKSTKSLESNSFFMQGGLFFAFGDESDQVA